MCSSDLEDGMEVICTGRITTYPGRSKYQIVIESMELAGEGALLKLIEDRRKRLAAEGLFDPERKRPLPFLPEVIGVITSPTGAVIRDILHRLADRFPRRVLLWPVLVQGEGAAEQVAAAIRFKPEAQVCAAEELKQFCREHLAPHKSPEYWFICEAFPLTGSGKVQKFRLKELAQIGRAHV